MALLKRNGQRIIIMEGLFFFKKNDHATVDNDDHDISWSLRWQMNDKIDMKQKKLFYNIISLLLNERIFASCNTGINHNRVKDQFKIQLILLTIEVIGK